MKIHEVAKKIVKELDNASQPGKCTWGDEYPLAQAQLFQIYGDDMEEIITKHIKEFALELLSHG